MQDNERQQAFHLLPLLAPPTALLTAKQTRLLTCLASGMSVRQAARECRISEATAYRYLRDNAFRRALQEAQSLVASSALGRLRAASSLAVAVLLKLLMDPDCPPATKRQVAIDILLLPSRALQAGGVEERLSKLETLAGLIEGDYESDD